MQKILHYVWLGHGPKGEKFEQCLNSWKKFCPDYEIKEWNEDNFDFSDCEFAVQAYDAKKYAFVSDYIRIRVLQQYGGIYLDTDVEIVKNIDEITEHNTVIGFENGGYLESNFIASEKNQLWQQKMIDFYHSNNFLNGKKQNSLPNTLLLTTVFKKHYGLKLKNKYQNLKDDVIVYPSSYFSPKDLHTHKINLTENTYSIHHFDATWTDKKFSAQQKFLKFIKKIFGNKIFDFFTIIYTKIVTKKLSKKI